MAEFLTIDMLPDFLRVIGFVPLPGMAFPQYIEAEVVQEETSNGVDVYAIQRPPHLHSTAAIVLQSDFKKLAR